MIHPGCTVLHRSFVFCPTLARRQVLLRDVTVATSPTRIWRPSASGPSSRRASCAASWHGGASRSRPSSGRRPSPVGKSQSVDDFLQNTTPTIPTRYVLLESKNPANKHCFRVLPLQLLFRESIHFRRGNAYILADILRHPNLIGDLQLVEGRQVVHLEG